MSIILKEICDACISISDTFWPERYVQRFHVRSFLQIYFSRDQWSDKLISFLTQNSKDSPWKSQNLTRDSILEIFENREPSLETRGSSCEGLFTYFWVVLYSYKITFHHKAFATGHLCLQHELLWGPKETLGVRDLK